MLKFALFVFVVKYRYLFMKEENGNNSGLENDNSFPRTLGSRQGSPSHEAKNGNIKDEPGDYGEILNFLTVLERWFAKF